MTHNTVHVADPDREITSEITEGASRDRVLWILVVFGLVCCVNGAAFAAAVFWRQQRMWSVRVVAVSVGITVIGARVAAAMAAR